MRRTLFLVIALALAPGACTDDLPTAVSDPPPAEMAVAPTLAGDPQPCTGCLNVIIRLYAESQTAPLAPYQECTWLPRVFTPEGSYIIWTQLNTIQWQASSSGVPSYSGGPTGPAGGLNYEHGYSGVNVSLYVEDNYGRTGWASKSLSILPPPNGAGCAY